MILSLNPVRNENKEQRKLLKENYEFKTGIHLTINLSHEKIIMVEKEFKYKLEEEEKEGRKKEIRKK